MPFRELSHAPVHPSQTPQKVNGRFSTGEFRLKETLPKDIALKPDNNYVQQEDYKKLSVMIQEIEAEIAKETCTDASEWRISPIGSKPCGGPSSYIAYPIKIENEILPKIKNVTQMQSAFNQKYGIISDCAVVPAPSGIRCENGKGNW